jgi:MtaA/CmuA family methyltransferase
MLPPQFLDFRYFVNDIRQNEDKSRHIMNSRERMSAAMKLQTPDRVPVMCQLALGHYFLYSGLTPFDVWYTSEGFADALLRLQKNYNFDGILVNLPGRDPNLQSEITAIEPKEGADFIHWRNGNYSVLPADDNAHYYQPDGTRYFPTFEEIRPEELFYIEPWDVSDITYPFTWGFESEARTEKDFFPSYHLDALKIVKQRVGSGISVHAEIFSPWSQFLELLNYENALMALFDDPGKTKACLERLTEGAIALGTMQAKVGADAILISSAFAGAGFISRKHYQEFVLPYERKIVVEIQKEYHLPIYTHTCGSIGDRLDLMIETGTNGIDTLDPPPLGTIDLEEAKKTLSGKVFIKGNIDPVNTLLNGDHSTVQSDIMRRIEIGKTGGGFILSTACSIAPHTPPKNIELLSALAETFGKY